MKILIIEDERRVANLIKKGLEEYHYNAELAMEGIQGRKMALSEEYDVIIMDILLPDMNGLDLCKQIRQAKPQTPIIMLNCIGYDR